MRSEVIWQMHKQHGKFSEKAKVGTGSQGTLTLASFTHTSNTSSLPTCTLHAPPLLRTPIPAAATSPSQSRPADYLTCSKGNKRPQPRKGSPSQLVREAEWKREPAPTLIASYRLWSSPPPAEPRCFPPSSRSSLGTQGAGAGHGSQPAQRRLAMGLAPERTRCSARGRPPRWERESRRRRRARRAERMQVRAEAGGGRRGRGAVLGSGGARVARVLGATGWKREPLTASPRARRPLPSPPLPPAAKSLDWGGAGLGALTTEHPDLKETGGDSESCPVPPRALLDARNAGSAEGLQAPTPSHRTVCESLRGSDSEG